MVRDEKYGGGIQGWSSLVPLLVPNWFDFNPGAPPFPPDSGYFYWGLPTLFAVGWALWRRTLRAYAPPLAVAAVCFLLVANPL